MGWGIKLTEAQWDELDRCRFSTGSADVFRNCLIILYSDSSDTISEIASRLGCGTETVTRVRRLYRKGGVAALQPARSPGRPSQATPKFIHQMKRAVQTNPMRLGYGFSNWSAARLAAHLDKVTGIRFSDDHMRRLLHQEGFSVHRPKHTLKGKRNESDHAAAKRKLARLKKKP
jgi:transposase